MLNRAVLRFVSENALLVEFGDTLDDRIHHQVLALDAALSESGLADAVETQPTFRSLLIFFDPFSLKPETLLQAVSALDTEHVQLSSRRWRVPICFSSECAEDLAEVADQLAISEAEVLQTLLTTELKLYMYGFAPGFAYLGGLDERLGIPRRATPRKPMPAGSLMIAGGLASLSSVSMPTGWYVVGSTPLTMFSTDRPSMVPFAVGDHLQLYRVSETEFAELARDEALNGLELL